MNLRTWAAEYGRVYGQPITLSPYFCEWLMGVPLGWTDAEIENSKLDYPTANYSPWKRRRPSPNCKPRAVKDRGRRISACGNGVVPICAQRFLDESIIFSGKGAPWTP